MLVSLTGFPEDAFSKTPLVVYTTLETDGLGPLKAAFESAHPGIEIKYVRDSAGPITARLIAEKNAPQADVIFILNAIGLEDLKRQGMLEPYAIRGREKLSPAMLTDDDMWTGAYAYGTAICVNENELKERGLPMPETWEDLIKPEYEGLIVMPNPASSGVGYTLVYGWLKSMGEEKGWEFMDALHKNIKLYTHGGSKPAQLAAQGESLIGLASKSFTPALLEQGAPLAVIEPRDGLSWEKIGAALPKNGRHPEEAKLLLDFLASDRWGKIMAARNVVNARQDYTTDTAKITEKLLMPLDFADAAARKPEILRKWRERYEK